MSLRNRSWEEGPDVLTGCCATRTRALCAQAGCCTTRALCCSDGLLHNQSPMCSDGLLRNQSPMCSDGLLRNQSPMLLRRVVAQPELALCGETGCCAIYSPSPLTRTEWPWFKITGEANTRNLKSVFFSPVLKCIYFMWVDWVLLPILLFFWYDEHGTQIDLIALSTRYFLLNLRRPIRSFSVSDVLLSRFHSSTFQIHSDWLLLGST